MTTRGPRRGRLPGVLLLGLAVLTVGGCRPEPRRANLDFVLKDMDGRDVRLADFRGMPLVVNLWATWCVPCQREMPQLVVLAEDFAPRGVLVLGISTDDAPEEIRAFARAFGVTYPLLVGRDQPDALHAFEYTGLLPTTVFIDRAGFITDRLVGTASDAYFRRKIEGLLRVPAGAGVAGGR